MTLAILVFILLAVMAAIELAHRVLVRLGRRYAVIARLTRLAHRPFASFAFMLTVDIALRHSGLYGAWRRPVVHLLDIVVIAVAAWLLVALLFVIEDAALTRFSTEVQDNRQARTVHTQIQLLRRVTVAAVAVIAFGAILLTFREARIVGTSLLASAGLVAAVTAFAAQTLLGNVIAGLQIAFGQSLRLADVVVIGGEWGLVEEITLTYVVVHIWDDRRLILPTSYFTNNPFQVWTRRQSHLLGAVEMDVDWTVPVDEMREALRAILTDNPMWDGRISVLQVTDALHGLIHLRALVSARDAPTLWDLRCQVREQLIYWLREQYPQAIPRWRSETTGAPGPVFGVAEPPVPPGSDPDSRVFSGDPAKRRRGREFHGPDEPG